MAKDRVGEERESLYYDDEYVLVFLCGSRPLLENLEASHPFLAHAADQKASTGEVTKVYNNENKA